MNDLLEFLQNKPWLNAMSILLAITGLITTIYYALKGKKEKLPSYSHNTYNLFSKTHSTIDHLEINYNGQALNNLNITKFGFWNAGKQTIDQNDIAPSNPLFITPDEGKILKVDIIHQVNPSNNFIISQENGKIRLGFDYVDYNEGVVIQLFHEQYCKFSMTGNLKGVSEIKAINPKNLAAGVFAPIRRLNLDLRSSNNRSFKIFFFLIFPLIPIFLDPLKFFDFKSFDKILTSIVYGFMILLYWMFAFYYYRRKIPINIDKELNKKTAYNST